VIAAAIVDSAYRVHKTLGPGLLEAVYEACLCHELRKRCISARRQVILPINYDSQTIDDGLRLELLVENSVICELKAVETMHPVFMAQLLVYFKLANKRLGFLINFNVPLIQEGITRLIRRQIFR
jgi:GxxExxY protein